MLAISIVRLLAEAFLLGKRSQDKLSLRDARMRYGEPADPVCVLGGIDLANVNALITVDEQIEVDDPWSVAERLGPSDRAFDPLQRSENFKSG
jgi:hypothetical protein